MTATSYIFKGLVLRKLLKRTFSVTMDQVQTWGEFSHAECLTWQSYICTVHHSEVKLTHLVKLKPRPKPARKKTHGRKNANHNGSSYTQEKGKIPKPVLLSSCRQNKVYILFIEQILGEMLPSIEYILELPMSPQEFLRKYYALRDV